MGTPAIVQARLGSHRLPGKVLREAEGKTVLMHVVDRLRQSKLSDIVVAISNEKSDDALAEYCLRHGLVHHRGPLNDVAARFAEVIERFRFRSFARICADSPLLDPRVVDEALRMFEGGAYEIVTNVLNRSFPNGQSVEVFDAGTFLKGQRRITDPADKEHVTSFFYKNAAQFKIGSFSADQDYSNVRLCVDTPEDFERFQLLLRTAKRPIVDYGWREMLKDLS